MLNVRQAAVKPFVLLGVLSFLAFTANAQLDFGSVTGFAHPCNLLDHGFTGRAVVSRCHNDRLEESNGFHSSASV